MRRLGNFRRPLAALLLIVAIAGRAVADLAVEVSVEPGKPGRWQLEYELSEPVDALVFARGNGDYRDETWRLQRGFVLERLGATDRVRRKNGKRFQRFKATVSTYSERVPKDYTPFIPFSDGSVAMFSGQFIVGVPDSALDSDFIDGADNGNTRWPAAATMELGPGRFGKMIVGTRVVEESQRIVLAEGEYVYFGSASALETDYLTSVMDGAAPDWLRDLLYESMAVTFEFYADRLGPLAAGKPFMLTSFTPLEGRRISFTGGVIGAQIAIQLALGDGIVDKPSEREFMARFFAHESAHLWNNGQVIAGNATEAWLHEGSAEAMAWLALAELGIHSNETALGLFQEAANACIDFLASGSLATAGRRDEFQAYYDCGATIALASHGAMQTVGGDLFTLWRELITSSQGGDGTYAASDYYRITDGVAPELSAAIRQLAGDKLADPRAAVHDLLEAGGVPFIDAGGDTLGLTQVP